jgi:hypothetical protein
MLRRHASSLLILLGLVVTPLIAGCDSDDHDRGGRDRWHDQQNDYRRERAQEDRLDREYHPDWHDQRLDDHH